jgi:hypothetical protein
MCRSDRRQRMVDSALRLTLLAASCLSGALAQTTCEQSGAGIFMTKFGPPIGGHASSFNWWGLLLVSSVGYRADGKVECD